MRALFRLLYGFGLLWTIVAVLEEASIFMIGLGGAMVGLGATFGWKD